MYGFSLILIMASIGSIESTCDDSFVDDCYALALDLLQPAGKCLLEGFQQSAVKNIEFKTGNWDLVTDYDRRIEDILIRGIAAKYPDHK